MVTHKKNSAPLDINFQQLDRLSKGKPEFKNQVLVLIRDQAKDMLTEIPLKWDAKDWKGMTDISHKFKSSVHIVSQDGHKLMHQFETAAKKQQNDASFERQYTALLQFCGQLIKIIDQEIHP